MRLLTLGFEHQFQSEPEREQVTDVLSETLEAVVPVLEGQVVFAFGLLDGLLAHVLDSVGVLALHLHHVEVLAKGRGGYHRPESLLRVFGLVY